MNEMRLLETMANVNAAEPMSASLSHTTRKPRIWTVFAAWFAAVVAGQIATIAGYVVVGVGMGVVMGAQGLDAATIQARVQEAVQQPLPALLLSLLPFQFGMAAVVLLAASISQEPLKQRLGLMPASVRRISRLRLAMMAAFTVSTALASVIGSSLLLGPVASTPISAIAENGSWQAMILLSVLLSIVPALIEEIVFRGYIQRRLLARWSPMAAIGLSTLLFALIHADSLQHIIAVVPLGVVTGLLAYRTNSVMPGMLVHAVHNAAAVGFGALIRVMSPQLGNEGIGLLMLGAVAVLGLLGLPAVISLLRRAPSHRGEMPLMVPQTGMEPLARPVTG